MYADDTSVNTNSKTMIELEMKTKDIKFKVNVEGKQSKELKTGTILGITWSSDLSSKDQLKDVTKTSRGLTHVTHYLRDKKIDRASTRNFDKQKKIWAGGC